MPGATMPRPRAIASSVVRNCTSVPRQPDRARIRPLDAVENAHQRGLAGAVLAHHRVDLALIDGEIDASLASTAP